MDLCKELGVALNPIETDKTFAQMRDELRRKEAITCNSCGNVSEDNKFRDGLSVCTNCDSSWQYKPLPQDIKW